MARPSQSAKSRFWKRVAKLEIPMKCVYCNQEVSRETSPAARNRATIDHLTPLSQGGTNNFLNMVISCWPCNVKKGRKDFYAE